MRLLLLHPNALEAQRLAGCLVRGGHQVARLQELAALPLGRDAGGPDVLLVHSRFLATGMKEDLGRLDALRREGMVVLAILGGEPPDFDRVDDFVFEPVRDEELHLRLRYASRLATRPPEREIHLPPYVFKPESHEVTLHGRPVRLTTKEYDLALQLFRRAGEVLSRSELARRVWGHNEDVESRTLDAHVSNVRRKLAIRPENGFRLASIYGLGYSVKMQTTAKS